MKSAFVSKLKSYDSFGEDVGFSTGNGQRNNGTWFGLFMTGFILAVVATYSVKVALEMKDGSNTRHLSYTKDGGLDATFLNETGLRFNIILFYKDDRIIEDYSIFDERSFLIEARFLHFESITEFSEVRKPFKRAYLANNTETVFTQEQGKVFDSLVVNYELDSSLL
jgi:hypothetical protein